MSDTCVQIKIYKVHHTSLLTLEVSVNSLRILMNIYTRIITFFCGTCKWRLAPLMTNFAPCVIIFETLPSSKWSLDFLVELAVIISLYSDASAIVLGDPTKRHTDCISLYRSVLLKTLLFLPGYTRMNNTICVWVYPTVIVFVSE